MNGMSERLKPPAAGNDGTHVAHIDEFYVRRINWLITIGRSDLIDEIADDCERRRTAPPTGGECPAAEVGAICSTPAAHRPSPNARAATPSRDCDLADPNPAGQAGERRNVAHNTSVADRPPHSVHHGRDIHAAPVAAGLPPRPVETGTRLAVARLRRSPRPGYRHMPDGQSIRG
jgi:hypothetical protein